MVGINLACRWATIWALLYHPHYMMVTEVKKSQNTTILTIIPDPAKNTIIFVIFCFENYFLKENDFNPSLNLLLTLLWCCPFSEELSEEFRFSNIWWPDMSDIIWPDISDTCGDIWIVLWGNGIWGSVERFSKESSSASKLVSKARGWGAKGSKSGRYIKSGKMTYCAEL